MTHQNNLNTLLDLNGMIIKQVGGYWVKFEVRRVDASAVIPHGIRYSLTLHDNYGVRTMGFDNAHGVKKKIPYDHQHRYFEDSGVPYEFINPIQLLTDFWSEVDKILDLNGLTTSNLEEII